MTSGSANNEKKRLRLPEANSALSAMASRLGIRVAAESEHVQRHLSRLRVAGVPLSRCGKHLILLGQADTGTPVSCGVMKNLAAGIYDNVIR